MDFLESLKLSLSNLLSYKVRSFLTMLGIIIGIGAVIMMSSLGAGMKQNITGDLNKLGVGNFNISIDTSPGQTYKTEDLMTEKDIENIKVGKLVGSKNNQDLMVAGNAIERSHKNISEISNFMLSELHFPYVIFLEGSNFLTENISIERPDGRIVVLNYDSGALNRLDRLSSANYGMPFNTNLCVNKFIKHKDRTIMLQAASIYTTGNGSRWKPEEIFDIMLEISETSLQMLGRDIFKQITKK